VGREAQSGISDGGGAGKLKINDTHSAQPSGTGLSIVLHLLGGRASLLILDLSVSLRASPFFSGSRVGD